MSTKTEQVRSEISSLLRARNTFLWINTEEEWRAENTILEAALDAKYDVLFWDCYSGLSKRVAEGVEIVDARLTDPMAVYRKIATDTKRAVYVLRDLHNWLATRNPAIIRGLRSLARDLEGKPRSEARAVIVLAPSGEIPPDYKDQVVQIDFPLPDREEMRNVVDCVISPQSEEVKQNASKGDKDKMVDAVMGLTAKRAEGCCAKSIVLKKDIVPSILTSEKKRIIAGIKGLEWYDVDPRGLDAIGGLEEAKAWAMQRRNAFSQAAREYGLRPPKGVLLVGVQGCGKSLLAKCLGTAWAMPLLRMDMGAVKSKWVGESEAGIRKVLAMAEVMAPCILWADEIEKALAGAGSGAADGGVSMDALGAMLTWMQDEQGVFVVATANNIDLLPPELIRKGRLS